MMSKNQAMADKQPSQALQALKDQGTTQLSAATRDELASKFDALKAEADGLTLAAGAVGQNLENGTFILRVDILN